MTVTKKTTHVTEAQARLPGHLKPATNVNKIVEIFANRFQILEDELDLLLNNVTDLAANAVGVQLDTIGIILNTTRIVGESDPVYRIRLQGEAARLSRSGEPETVIATYLLMAAATEVILVEHDPATIELFATILSDTFTPEEDQAMIDSMNEVVAAGVGTILAVQLEPDFLWGDDADADANGDLPDDAEHGFGDDADADGFGDIISGAGGKFARLLTGVAQVDDTGIPLTWYSPLSEPIRSKKQTQISGGLIQDSPFPFP